MEVFIQSGLKMSVTLGLKKSTILLSIHELPLTFAEGNLHMQLFSNSAKLYTFAVELNGTPMSFAEGNLAQCTIHDTRYT